MYRKNLHDAGNYKYAVIKASTNIKLGKKVTKGHLKGARIFTLTLEERATCDSECEHWLDCYGNNMPFGHRFKANNMARGLLLGSVTIQMIPSLHRVSMYLQVV
jgi:hypothetical protein